MAITEKVIDLVSGIVDKGLDKIIPDKYTDEEKAKMKQEMQIFLQTQALQEDNSLRNFILDYEGKALDVPKFIQIIRSLIRPLLTVLITGAYIYGWIKPERFTIDQMLVLKPALLIVLIFWFGDRALQKSGILDVLKKKEENK